MINGKWTAYALAQTDESWCRLGKIPAVLTAIQTIHRHTHYRLLWRSLVGYAQGACYNGNTVWPSSFMKFLWLLLSRLIGWIIRMSFCRYIQTFQGASFFDHPTTFLTKRNEIELKEMRKCVIIAKKQFKSRRYSYLIRVCISYRVLALRWGKHEQISPTYVLN